MPGNDGFNVNVKTTVEGLDELKKAIADFEAFKKTIDLSDRSIKDFVKEGDSAARTLRDIERASQKVQTPEFASWSKKWHDQIPEIKKYKTELDTLAVKLSKIAVDPETGKAIDKNLQPTLDKLNKSYGELTAQIHLARQVQNEFGREMGKLRSDGKEFMPIDYDALSEKAKNAKVVVTDTQTKITNTLEAQAAAQKKAQEAAAAAAHTQKSAYKSIDDTLWNTQRKLNDLTFDAKRMSSDLSKAKDVLSRGGKIDGSDVEQYNDKLNDLVKGSEDAAKTIDEVTRKISELHFSGALPEDIFKHLSSELIKAKDGAELLGHYLSEITPKGEETFGPIIEQLNEIKAVQEQINSLDMAKAIAFDDKGTIDTYNGLVNNINQLIEKLEETVYVENTTIATNKNLQVSWLMVDQTIDAIKDGLEQLRGSTAVPPELDAEYQNLNRLLEALKLKSKEYLNETRKSLGIETKSAKSKRELAHQVKSLSDGLNDAKKNMSKLGDAVSGVTKSIKSKMTHGLKSIMKYVLGFRSLFFLVRKLRSAIKEGLENLVQFDSANNETNKSISELRSSLLFVKNAWAAAFAPIINYVMPLLTSLIDTLAQVGNAIARFFAQLTGQATVLQAVKVDMGDYADSLKKTGSAAGGAAKKAKDLHDRLAPFDDLQVLGVDKDKDTSGSGGGGGGLDDMLPDPNEMFKRIQTESNLADMIKEAWKNQDFSGLGKLAGEKIRDSFNSINWADIRENVSKGISSVTSFINGFIQSPGLFASAGRTMADGLNTLTGAIKQFFTEIDFFNNAKSVGEGFTSFFTNLDIGQLAGALSSVLKSLPDTISGFLDGVNWKSLGKSLYKGIKSFITNFDFAGLNKSLGKVVGYIIKAIADLAVGIGEELIKDLQAYFEEHSVEEIFKDIFRFLTGDTLLNWMMNNSGFPFAEGILEALGASKSDLEKATSSIRDTLTHPFTLAIEKIKEVFTGIGEWFNDHVIQPIVNFFKPIVNTVSTIFKTMLAIIVGIWITAADWFNETVVQPIIEFFAPIVDKVSEFFSKLWEGIKSIWIKVSDWFNENVISPVVDFFKGVYDKAYKYFSDLWSDICDVWEAASSWFDEHVISPIVKLFDGIAAAVKDSFNDVLGVVEKLLNKILQGLNSFIDKLNTWGKTGAEALGFEYTNIPNFKEITIPRLAKGAVIPPNKEFLAVLGDQKSGTNIEAPLDTIVDAFREVMGSLQVETGNQSMVVDGQVFARLMTPYIVSELGRLGYNIKILEA